MQDKVRAAAQLRQVLRAERGFDFAKVQPTGHNGFEAWRVLASKVLTDDLPKLIADLGSNVLAQCIIGQEHEAVA
ncbi:hypothetical protein D3C78_1500110 [compost metagenome]